VPIDNPKQTYEHRLSGYRETVERLAATESRLTLLRLFLFVVAVALAWPALFTDLLPWWVVLVPVLAFVPIVVWHARLDRSRELAGRAVLFYERGIARLEDRWPGTGSSGEGFRDPDHPYSSDLDIFGRGSLFELLSTARTGPGERTLAAWLLGPTDPETVRRRQQAVTELRGMLDLREQLAIEGDDVRAGVDADELVEWARQPPVLTARWPVAAAAVLAVTNVATIVAALFEPALWTLALFSWTLCAVMVAVFGRRVRQVLAAVERPEQELELLARLLERLESTQFRSPLLVDLRQSLKTHGLPPSRRIGRLARLVDMIESRRNMIFHAIASLLLLGTQFAFAVERWRAACGDGVERWLAAIGEIEALSSLAAYAYEHPDDPFPEILDGESSYVATGLGHPLLPSGGVRNDVELGGGRSLLLVSGSNMSGKSTLLRSVGVSTLMALAGAPVRAERLSLTPMAVGAAMRVSDSLQEGMSHFYAEIRRLRQILEIGEAAPTLLFLLDEILHGTNSHDRRIGAEALIRGLIEQGSVGLLTTHDLALARIAEELEPHATNVHFEDQLDGERIVFDYRLRPGVVQRGNAVALMRAIGLPV